MITREALLKRRENIMQGAAQREQMIAQVERQLEALNNSFHQVQGALHLVNALVEEMDAEYATAQTKAQEAVARDRERARRAASSHSDTCACIGSDEDCDCYLSVPSPNGVEKAEAPRCADTQDMWDGHVAGLGALNGAPLPVPHRSGD